MLTRLYADNYRCFVNFDLQPGQMCLLHGVNGSGKTSVFDLLWDLRRLIRNGDDVTHCFPATSRSAWEKPRPQRFEVALTDDAVDLRYQLEIEHDESGRAGIRRESVSRGDKPLFVFVDGTVQLFGEDHSPGATFAFGRFRSFLASVEIPTASVGLARFLAWFEAAWIFKLDPTAVRSSAMSEREEAGLFRDGGNFGAFYRYFVLDKPGGAQALQEDIRQVLSGLEHFRLQQYGLAKWLMARFRPEGAAEFELPFSVLSDGQALLVVLYTILHALPSGCRLLCIDEPDNFVALREIQPWLQKLRDKLDESECQLLVISHNAEVIDYLGAELSIGFTRPGGLMTRVKPLEVDPGGALSLSELVARGWEGGAE